MKQLLTYLMIGSAGLASATAMVVGEPAHADIAVVQAAVVLPDIIGLGD